MHFCDFGHTKQFTNIRYFVVIQVDELQTICIDLFDEWNASELVMGQIENSQVVSQIGIV